MTRLEFFQRLERGLSRLPREEVAGALSYYEEYFDDAGPEAEARVLAELGNPAKIAQQIVAESMVRTIVNPTEPVHSEAPLSKEKKGLNAVWTVLLAVFAAPIALPMAIAIAAVIFALAVAAAAMVLAFFLLSLCLIVGGVLGFFMGCATLTAHVLTGLCAIGVGLALTGVGLLVLPPAIWLARTTFTAIARSIGRKIFQKKGATT